MERSELERKLQQASDPDQQVQAQVALSLHLSLIGALPEALEQAEQALERAQVLGNLAHIAASARACAISHYAQGQFEPSARLYQQALEDFERVQDVLGIGQCLNGLGLIHLDVGNYPLALEHFERSIEQRRQLGDPHSLAPTYNNLGILYARLGKLGLAAEFYNRAYALWREGGNARRQGVALLNLGSVALERAKASPEPERTQFLQEVLETHQRVLEIAQQTADLRHRSAALNNLAERELLLGEVERARALYREQCALLERSGEQMVMWSVHLGLGRCAEQEGRLHSARAHFQKALDCAEAVGLRPDMAQICQRLSACYEGLGQPAEALALYKRFHALEREALNAESERQAQATHLRLSLERLGQDLERSKRERELLENEHHRLRQEADHLRWVSTQDALTGLSNRRGLEQALRLRAEQAQAQQTPLSVAVADIDHFKQVNDRFSHAAGDAVLARLAELLRQGCRDGDTVARYGGEEFVLVLPNAGLDVARQVCERLRQTVEHHDWSSIHPQMQVTLSIGLSELEPGGSPERLLLEADARLYAAKRGGRNRVSPPLEALEASA